MSPPTSRVRKTTGLPRGLLDDRAVHLGLTLEPGQRRRQHELQFGAEQPYAVGAGFRQVGDVYLQSGIDVQLDALAVLGDGGLVAQRAVLALAPRTKTGLVAIGGDDAAARPDVHLAAFGVDDDGIALIDPFDDPARLADGGNPERLGNDGNMALPAGVLDDQPAQAGTIVVEQVGRAHAARNKHGVVGQIGDGPARARTAGKDAQAAGRRAHRGP